MLSCLIVFIMILLNVLFFSCVIIFDFLFNLFIVVVMLYGVLLICWLNCLIFFNFECVIFGMKLINVFLIVNRCFIINYFFNLYLVNFKYIWLDLVEVFIFVVFLFGKICEVKICLLLL